MSLQEQQLMTARKAWSGPKTCHAFTGYVQSMFGSNPYGLVLRCLSQDDIPCTLEDRKGIDTKTLIVRFTILRVSNIGWGKAPKKMKGGKEVKDPNSKPLLEEFAGGTVVGVGRPGQKTVTGIKMYNFKRTFSPTERGDRLDDSVSVLYVGETISVCLSDFMYSGDTARFPVGVNMLPKGSIVEISVNPAADGEGLDKGYGLKVSQIHLHNSSLYSYAVPDSLGLFPSTLDEGKNFLSKFLENGAHVRMCIDSTNVTLYGLAMKGSYTQQVSEDLEWIRLTNDGGQVLSGVPDMDIHPTDLMRCVNCPGDLVLARTLLDLAAAAGALNVFVYESKYFAKNQPLLSHYRFFPVIDLELLFKPVVFSEPLNKAKCQSFPLDYTLPNMGQLEMYMPLRAVSQIGDKFVSVPTRDFALVSDACSFETGYKFMVVEKGGEENNVILEMFFVASFASKEGPAVSTGRTAYSKRTFDIMNDDYDEDDE